MDEIRHKKAILSEIKERLCRVRRDLSVKGFAKAAKLKQLYRSISKKLKTLQQLERKKVLTLIIEDYTILTVYKKEKRDKHYTERNSFKRQRAGEAVMQ